MSTTFKQVKDNAIARILTNNALNNITNPKTVSLEVGSGARLPDTASGSFYVTIWDALTYADPYDDPQMELALVTVRSGDDLTMTRAAAVAHTGKPYIAILLTAQQVQDIHTAINAAETNIDTNATNISDLDSEVTSGWKAADQTWTYASATTITVPTDATTRYAPGDRIKLTQSSTVKYFVVVAVAATTLTITGGTDYTLANSAISANYYSKDASPVGFPDWFKFTPSYVASGGTPSTYTGTNVGKFRVIGRTCVVQFYSINSAGGTVGSGAVALNLTLPVNADTTTTAANTVMGGSGIYFNNASGANVSTFISGPTTMGMKKNSTGNLLADDQNNVTRQLMGEVTYQI